MGLILDASALVEMERSGAGLGDAFAPEDRVYLPAIVWSEALVGARLADSAARAARRLARLESIRRLTGVVAFDAELAEHYADIFAEFHVSGQLIPQNDIVVAATGRYLDAEVVVGPGDEKPFRRVTGFGSAGDPSRELVTANVRQPQQTRSAARAEWGASSNLPKRYLRIICRRVRACSRFRSGVGAAFDQ